MPSPGERQRRYRAVIGHFATGVSVITGQGPAGPGGMTANAVCSLSLEPLLLLVCFENTARTLPVIRQAGRFAVNVLATDQRLLSHVFASKRPEPEKFDGVTHHLHRGVPLLDGTHAWLVCALRELVPAGDHTIAIGEVLDMDHADDREPLIWYRGQYRTLAPEPLPPAPVPAETPGTPPPAAPAADPPPPPDPTA
jgi:3-hydroxy-9,10-secoandrosta-1,3,5(10)-triene-9,17-dione monooxygenase reductase component